MLCLLVYSCARGAGLRTAGGRGRRELALFPLGTGDLDTMLILRRTTTTINAPAERTTKRPEWLQREKLADTPWFWVRLTTARRPGGRDHSFDLVIAAGWWTSHLIHAVASAWSSHHGRLLGSAYRTGGSAQASHTRDAVSARHLL